MAASRHIGTIRMMASGSDQLSYCAASTRKTNTTASGKTSLVKQVLARLDLLVGQLGPLEAHAGRQLLPADLVHHA